jgi:hypothetical protein
MSFPKKKQPLNKKVLETWIRDYAKLESLPQTRVHRAVGFMLVALVLDRSLDAKGDPLFVLKGGVSMELRLGLRARTTRDYDTVYRGTFEEWLSVLDDALEAAEIEGFEFSRGEPEEIRDTKTFRVDIVVDYKGRRWGKVQFEVAPVEIEEILDIDQVESFDIGQFGLPSPNKVSVVALPYLIAQKLHACTEEVESEEKARIHDLMDLLLARDLLEPDDLARVKEACVAIFASRGKQPWPPELVVYQGRAVDFANLAEDEGFPIAELEEAAGRVRAFIAEIETARPSDPAS